MSSAPIPLNITILLLASDPVVRVVFQEILERAGYVVVHWSASLGDAVARLKESTRPICC